eukprot:5237451-Pleurochrysis_carterae.AAC.1
MLPRHFFHPSSLRLPNLNSLGTLFPPKSLSTLTPPKSHGTLRAHEFDADHSSVVLTSLDSRKATYNHTQTTARKQRHANNGTQTTARK